MLSIVENARRKQLDWIAAILAHRRWRPSRLAKEAGVDHSTLSKFLNDPSNTAQLNTLTVEKLEAAGGIRAYDTAPPRPVAGLAEGEAEPFIGQTMQTGLTDLLRTLTGQANGLDPWIMRSRALEGEGYMPGDILLVDLNASARDGDVVCAQVYDRAGRAETVMRVFEAPYLVSATTDRQMRKPLLVDNEHVVIRGVVNASLRGRRTPAAA